MVVRWAAWALIETEKSFRRISGKDRWIMARRAKASAYRPVVTRRVNGKVKRRRSKSFWAKYLDNTGATRCHVLKLPNGMRITDKDVARSELDKIINRLEREAVGLVDRTLEAASVPIQVALAGFIRYLRRHRKGRK